LRVEPEHGQALDKPVLHGLRYVTRRTILALREIDAGISVIGFTSLSRQGMVAAADQRTYVVDGTVTMGEEDARARAKVGGTMGPQAIHQFRQFCWRARLLEVRSDPESLRD
jgi:hypothetical protein